MSKILKRPMFRRGGEVMTGIMSGIQPRSNYAEAGLAKRFGEYKDILQSVAPVSSGFDPVAKFLITGGLKGLSQTGGGSTLANLAKAFEKPTEQLFTDIESREKPKQALNLTAAELAIKGQQAVEQEQAKAKKTQFAAETFPARYQAEVKGLRESEVPEIRENAGNIAFFKESNPDKPYIHLNFTYSTQAKKYIPNYNALPSGAISYDPTRNLAIQKTKEGKIIFLNPFTFEPIPDAQVGGQ